MSRSQKITKDSILLIHVFLQTMLSKIEINSMLVHQFFFTDWCAMYPLSTLARIVFFIQPFAMISHGRRPPDFCASRPEAYFFN
jgi:hypothetical protein